MALGPILIITNPTSGRGLGLPTTDAVAMYLRRRGVDVTVRHTTARGEAEAIAAEALGRELQSRGLGPARTSSSDPAEVQEGIVAPAPGAPATDAETTDAEASRGGGPAESAQDRPTCIVACGGDGTVQEVANALADAREHSPVMGIAPAGRCNDFARALGIPTGAEGIAEVLLSGLPRPIDLGMVNGRCFCTVAALGVDAEVTGFVDTMRMPLRGTIAYLYGSLCVLARYQPCRVRIAGDFGVIDKPVFLASTANTSVYGGAIQIAPEASPTDGMLDLCVIDAVSRFRSLTLLPTVLMGRHGSCPEVQFIRTKRLTIEAEKPLELWADGERIARTPVTIQVVPGAVRIMLPRRWQPDKASRV